MSSVEDVWVYRCIYECHTPSGSVYRCLECIYVYMCHGWVEMCIYVCKNEFMQESISVRERVHRYIYIYQSVERYVRRHVSWGMDVSSRESS